MYLVVNMLCSRVDKHWCRMILHHHLIRCADPPDARFARSEQALLFIGGETSVFQFKFWTCNLACSTRISPPGRRGVSAIGGWGG